MRRGGKGMIAYRGSQKENFIMNLYGKMEILHFIYFGIEMY